MHWHRRAFRMIPRWRMAAVASVVAIATLVTVSVLQPEPQRPAKPVRLVTAEWAPYVSSNLPAGGPVASVVKDVFRRAGYEPEVDFTSWAMTESSVDGGSSLALFPVVASKERRAKYLLSDPIAEFEYVLFHRASDSVGWIDTPAQLRGKRVGLVSGYDYCPELDEAVSKDAVQFDSALDAFIALQEGKVDFIAEGLLPGQSVLASAEFPGDAADVTFLQGLGGKVRSSKSLRLVMRRSSGAERVMRDFNAALSEYRRSDRYDEVTKAIDAPPREVGRVAREGGGSLRAHGDEHYLPVGTRVAVLAWPQNTSSSREHARVKVLDGPLAGRVGEVAVGDLEIVESVRP